MTQKHEALGGSWSDIWTNCTGAYFLKQKMPPKEISEAMALGTRAHNALEYLNGAFLKHKLEGTEWPVTWKDQEVIEIALQSVEVIWEKVLFESITGKAYGIEDKFYINKSLSMGGFVDFWCIYIDDKGKRVLAVFDFKHGYHDVQAEKNPQIAFYVCAIREAILAKGKDIDYARGIIYQPRIMSGEQYKETKLTIKQLEAWKKKFLQAGNDIMVHKKANFKAGDHCKWCQAQAICPTYKKELSRTTSLKLLETMPEDEVSFPNIETIPDDMLAKLVLHGDKIVKFLDECKEYCKDRNLNKVPVKGTKCIYGNTRRIWKKDIEKDLEKLMIEQEYTYEEIYNLKLKGILEIQNLLAEKLGKKKAKEVLDAFVDQSNPPIKLVCETDEREAIKNSQTLLKNEEING